MLFKEKGSGLTIKQLPITEDIQKHFTLNGSIVNEMEVIKTVFKNETGRTLTNAKFFRMTVAYLIQSLEATSENEAIEILKKLYLDVN